MSKTPMYEVWFSKGEGTEAGPRFHRLEDALRYVEEHAGEATFAIRGPVGFWCQATIGRSSHERRLAR
jgi:hypothetical protein